MVNGRVACARRSLSDLHTALENDDGKAEVTVTIWYEWLACVIPRRQASHRQAPEIRPWMSRKCINVQLNNPIPSTVVKGSGRNTKIVETLTKKTNMNFLMGLPFLYFLCRPEPGATATWVPVYFFLRWLDGFPA